MHIIYATFPNFEEARNTARMLVEQNMVACVNINKDVVSLYKWEGKIEESQEVVMICKTSDSKVGMAINAIKQHHSYQCPCIIAIKVETGNPDFIEFVESSSP